MGDAASEPEILFEQRGCLGLVTLNRPKALNALTYGMIIALERQLDAWSGDGSISVVAIQGAGDKAFAAGGDIRALYDAGEGGRTGEKNFRFFADEYRVNTKIKRYPKPYVALMDGIVMGGGVGVSIHGSLRIATERTVFAMPETGIGLFPDVGGSYFLSRLKGELGMWLALTGSRLKGQECAQAGIADGFVPSDALPRVIEMLSVDGNLGHDPEDVAPGSIFYWGEGEHRFRPDADSCFSGASVEDVLEGLGAAQTEWAHAQRKAILTKSPSSTRIAFRQIREGASLDFEDCMRLEYRLARYCMTTPDFYEGVRAVILDKDNAPKWLPPSLTEASEEYVARAFEPLGEEELAFP
ncbi:MAG: enoyl-CoA hydratase/isomerase family protein [Paracoccaceae bacterium]|nr:enoyl-CoA hydratase/isomerase family protein [Paracoccaceae bacterium]